MKPPNPAAQEWLEQARHDLDTAERELLHTLTPACKQLTGFYIAARYLIGAHYTLADARRAVKAARKADFLVNKLFQG